MKKLLYRVLFCLSTISLTVSCMDMDIPPINILENDDVFSSSSGITAYFAKMYASLPLEDYRYSHNRGWNNERVTHNVGGITGEAVGRDTQMLPAVQWFQEGYALIREVNVFIQNLEQYKHLYTEDEINHWLGEAHMIRAFAYTTMAKRYGGVPLVTTVLEDFDQAALPRSSEEDVWDQIENDFQYAIEHMNGTLVSGRFNKYTAAAYKAQAMLHAASIANFSTIRHVDSKNGNTLVCGLPKEKAGHYYQLAYAASKQVKDGGYGLYLGDWQEDNSEAQYINFLNIHEKAPNVETIFMREFRYPELGHSWDAIYGPLQIANGGLSGGLTPSYDLVREYDRISPFVDENNNYILYSSTMEPFQEAEPRLRATVLLPGDTYRGEVIEVYRGIYTARYPAGGLKKLYSENDNFNLYQSNKDLLTSISHIEQQYYDLGNGRRMRAAGLSGGFNSENRGTRTGFLVRKFMDPNLPPAEVDHNRSELDWIDMRYAEVMLIQAEAAYELHALGLGREDYLAEAYDLIQEIRKRAGANLLRGLGELTQETIRRERKKELAFESKAYWDQVRWRVFKDLFPDNPKRKLKGALPFYVPSANKWFFDVKGVELGNAERVFPELWYYVEIPRDQISKNPNLVQNPGY